MLLFFAIAAGLVAFYLLVQTVRPLVESGVVTAAEWQRVEDESLQLLQRRDQLLAELQELEFEAALHKIDARDLEALRTRYALEAVELDKQIDARREVYDGRIDAQVEQTLADAARRRSEKGAQEAAKGDKSPADSVPGAPAAAAEPESKLSKAEPAAAGKAAADASPAASAGSAPSADDAADGCGRCGSPLSPDAAFCDGCGAPATRACAGCGAKNRAQARFCKSCGHRVDGEGA